MERLDLTLKVARRADSFEVELVETVGALRLCEHVVSPADLATVEDLSRKTAAAYRINSAMAESLGTAIGNVVLGPAIEAELQRASASQRIFLRLPGDAEFGCHIPWETTLFGYLNGTPLCLAEATHLIRQTRRPAIDIQPVTRTLRVLIAHADPSTREYPSLAGAVREVESVTRAFQSSECRSYNVEVLLNATPASLKRNFAAITPDVFHFVGHGIRRPTGSALILESGETGKALPLYGEELAALARSAGTQLVVLSGCETAGRFADVATKLAEDGIPIAIGMQYKIGDSSAQLFSRAVYGAIAEGASIEESVSQGRSALAGTAIDWASPVLYIDGPERSLASPTSVSRYFGEQRLPKHNLPFDDTPFVGRREELTELKARVLDPSQRLVTVTGMGGMGKTRLVRQVGSDLVDSYRDGVWLIDCERISDGEEMTYAVASALTLGLESPTEQALFAAIRDRNLLLIFDSFERVMSQRAFLQKLLSATKELKILVTSRSLLGLLQESEYALLPLSLDSRAGGLPDGVALFLASASRVAPALDRNPPDLRLVRNLVEGLEGVPLALILAAGRLRHFALRELAERVRTQRLQLLRRPGTGDQDKHTDLLKVVGDSFELLSEEHRSIAGLLSVFQGGFYHEDAAEVLGDSDSVLDAISTLRDHSLLITQAIAGRMRYRMLDTVREYIDQLPPSPGLGEAKRRHAIRFSLEAGYVSRLIRDGKWPQANALLWLEAGNFRTAIQTSIELGGSELIARFGRFLARPYFEAGRTSEFERLCDACLSIAKSEVDTELRIDLLGLRGIGYRRSGRITEAKSAWLERVDVSRESGAVDAEADALLDLADLSLASGDTTDVLALLNSFDAISERLGPGPLKATALIIKALSQIEQGELEEAVRTANEAEEATATLPSDTSMLYVWLKLARVFRLAKLERKALTVCANALSTSLEAGFAHASAASLLELAQIFIVGEHFVSAARSIVAAELAAESESLSMNPAIEAAIGDFLNKGGTTEALVVAQDQGRETAWKDLASTLLSGPIIMKIDEG